MSNVVNLWVLRRRHSTSPTRQGSADNLSLSRRNASEATFEKGSTRTAILSQANPPADIRHKGCHVPPITQQRLHVPVPRLVHDVLCGEAGGEGGGDQAGAQAVARDALQGSLDLFGVSTLIYSRAGTALRMMRAMEPPSR